MTHLYERQKRYYRLRASEYDATAWTLACEQEPGEVVGLIEALKALPAADTPDVACGTGFLTQYLQGGLTLLDASEEMLAIAGTRVPAADRVHGDGLALPFSDGSFERVFASAFYGHLLPDDRQLFLQEAGRVASELVLVEQMRGTSHWEGLQERTLLDGSAHTVYTTYFSPESLLGELGGGDLPYCGAWLLAHRR